jgi:hypothetical protein
MKCDRQLVGWNGRLAPTRYRFASRERLESMRTPLLRPTRPALDKRGAVLTVGARTLLAGLRIADEAGAAVPVPRARLA